MFLHWQITTRSTWLLIGGVFVTVLAGAIVSFFGNNTWHETLAHILYTIAIAITAITLSYGLLAGYWRRKGKNFRQRKATRLLAKLLDLNLFGKKKTLVANHFFQEEGKRVKLWEEVTQAGQWYYDLRNHDFTGTTKVWEIYGIEAPKSSEEKREIYEILEQRIHPKDRERSWEAIQKTLQGEPQVLDYRIIVNGKIRHLHTKRTPQYDKSGNIVGIYECSQDVTELVEAKLAAKASEHKTQKLLKNAPLFIGTLQPDLTVIHYSNWYEALGYTKEEISKMTTYDITHPDDIEETERHYGELLSGKSNHIRFEKRYLTKDGSTFTVDMSLIANRNQQGEVEDILLVAFDINERKRIEQELRKSEDILRVAAKSANIGMWDYNIQTGMVYWTAECSTIIGYPAEEAGLHHNYEFWERIYPDDLPKLQKAIQEHCEGKNDFYRVEFRVRCADGHLAWNVGMGKLVEWDKEGKPLRMAGIQADISPQKQLELELIRAREEAEKANIAKSTFLANMSHEIRTPMTAILGFTELLESTDLHEEEAKEFLKTIQRNGYHLLELINDILDLSKIDAGQFSVDRQPSDYWSVAKDAVKVMKVRAKKQEIELKFEPADKLPNLINTDAARLRQSLINLIGNAIKFTEKGSVRLRIDYLPVWKNDQPAVQFQVIDTGIGIEANKIEFLFAPFVQADKSMSRKQGGTGLGLAITKQITEMLDGEISVESELGKGSTFTIVLPVGDIANLRMLETSTRNEEMPKKQESLS